VSFGTTQLDPVVASCLVHDFLLARRGVQAPAQHPLRLAITRHKARLSAEFTKVRVRLGCATVEALREHVGREGAGEDAAAKTPRWVRVNALKSSLDEALRSTFADYRRVRDLGALLEAGRDESALYVDEHVPDLVAVPAGHDSLSKSRAYLEGEIVFQDKASCFPAYMLDPAAARGDIVDACAAPGNKTTQLAALLHQSPRKEGTGRIIAIERDEARSRTLAGMVERSGAGAIVAVLARTDFLATDPHSERFKDVGAILLDPSCSGSGIMGRDEAPVLHLPERKGEASRSIGSGQRKRKRGKTNLDDGGGDEQEAKRRPGDADGATAVPALQLAGDEMEDGEQRLRQLAAFQIKMLRHAMTFPSAARIVYSTCSVAAEENEAVVVAALLSDEAVRGRWAPLEREQQPEGLRRWGRRGDAAACEAALQAAAAPMGDAGTLGARSPEGLANCCVRCDRGGAGGTIGFFVAGFVRMNQIEQSEPRGMHEDLDEASDEEWNGFSDGD
jgi:putative methyltransferase